MKPRRRSRARLDRAFAFELQRHRLERIARNEIEPLCDRETFFLLCLESGRRVRVEDFIVPPPILHLETCLLATGGDEHDHC